MATRAPWARAAPGAPPPPAAAVPQVDPAAAAALHARGGELLPDRRGVRMTGWRVETEHKPIMGRDDLRRCGACCGAPRACARALRAATGP
jgi:hypothetical protein